MRAEGRTVRSASPAATSSASCHRRRSPSFVNRAGSSSWMKRRVFLTRAVLAAAVDSDSAACSSAASAQLVGNPSPTTIQPGMFPPAMPPPDSPPLAPYWDEGYNPVGLLATVFGAMFFGCPIAVSYGLVSRWILMRRLHRDGEPSIAKIVEKSQEYKAPNKNRRTTFWIYTVKVLMPAGDLIIEREDVVVDKELWDGVATSGSPRKGSSESVDVFTAAPEGATLEMVYLPSEPCVCDSADNAKPTAHKRAAVIVHMVAALPAMALGLVFLLLLTSRSAWEVGVFAALQGSLVCCVFCGAFSERTRGVVLPTTRPLKRLISGTIIAGRLVKEAPAGMTTVAGVEIRDRR